MKRVRAIDVGYDNVIVREVGDVFEMPDDATAPWFVDVDSPIQAVVKKTEGKTEDAKTLLGIQKQNAAANEADLI